MSNYKVVYTDVVEDVDTLEEAIEMAFHSMQEIGGVNFEIIDLETGESNMTYCEWNNGELIIEISGEK